MPASDGTFVLQAAEVDAIGGRRGPGGFGSNDEREQTLTELSTEMDAFALGANVVSGRNQPAGDLECCVASARPVRPHGGGAGASRSDKSARSQQVQVSTRSGQLRQHDVLMDTMATIAMNALRA